MVNEKKEFKKIYRFVSLPDNWDKNPYLFQTYNEPENYNLLPTLSNGYIGFVIHNESFYVQGLYNGEEEMSHRIRLPAMNSIYAFFNSADDKEIPTFTLDCRRGIYVKEVKTENAKLTQRSYAHRRFRNLLINEITVELLNDVDVSVEIHNSTKLNFDFISTYNNNINPSLYSYWQQDQNPEHLSFEQRVVKYPTKLSSFIDQNDGIYHLKTIIKDTEIPDKREKDVHIIYTNIPSKLNVYKNQKSVTFHFVLSVDTDYSRAYNAYNEALNSVQNDRDGLLNSHINSWEEIWQKSGFVMLSDNTYTDTNQDSFKLAQRLYASFYNLYSSIPVPLSSGPDNQFYGISPAGLAYGALKKEFTNASTTFYNGQQVSEGYGGHIMYNQDMWILPIISIFNRDMAKTVIQSRVRRGLNLDHISVYEQAKSNAVEEQADGIRYAWEQGDYGKDVSTWKNLKTKKLHVTGAVGFGLRTFLRMSHDKDFLLTSVNSDITLKGEDFINDIAKYWSSKLKYSSSKSAYEITNVLFGETNRDVNNEVYTNYLAKICIDNYKYALKLAEKDPYDSSNSYKVTEYDEKHDKTYMPYDSNRNLYLEFESFNTAQINSETWVPYLNYPLQISLNYNEKKAILDTYTQQISGDGKNTMAYASFLVGHLENNEETKAKSYFDRLSAHFNGPFQVFSEYMLNNMNSNQNTFNYLPGYASYLHSFISGYSALKIRDFQLDIIYPSPDFTGYTSQSSNSLPIKSPYQSVNYWNITGISYRGFELDIIYNLKNKLIEIKNRRISDGYAGSSTRGLEVVVYEYVTQVNKTLNVGETVTINLNSDSWKLNPKTKLKLQKNSHYSNNINILATIYPSQYLKHVKLTSNANKKNFNFKNLM